jgi:hypothetical protein
MRRLVVAIFALALIAAGCGGGDGGGAQSALETLAQTSANLGKIRSGDLAMNLLFSAKGGGRVGFSLEGPFSLRAGAPPEAQLDYTQIAGQRSATQTFIAAGNKAYVRVRGTTYELPQATAKSISGALGRQAGLGVVDLSSWMKNPRLSEGNEVGGADTDHISSDLNVPAAMSAILAIAAQLNGSGSTALSGASAEQVERAVQTATMDVWTGKEDRLLRKVDIAIELSPNTSEKLKRLLGAGIHFTLAISNPNEEVSIQAPQNAKPYPGS